MTDKDPRIKPCDKVFLPTALFVKPVKLDVESIEFLSGLVIVRKAA